MMVGQRCYGCLGSFLSLALSFFFCLVSTFFLFYFLSLFYFIPQLLVSSRHVFLAQKPLSFKVFLYILGFFLFLFFSLFLPAPSLLLLPSSNLHFSQLKTLFRLSLSLSLSLLNLILDLLKFIILDRKHFSFKKNIFLSKKTFKNPKNLKKKPKIKKKIES